MGHIKFFLLVALISSSFAEAIQESADDSVVDFKDYEVPVQINTIEHPVSHKVRLPAEDTDSFLSSFSDTADALDRCSEFRTSRENPLIRKSLTFEVKPSCRLEITDYMGRLYVCSLSTTERAEFSSSLRTSSTGSGLGDWSETQKRILFNSCDAG